MQHESPVPERSRTALLWAALTIAAISQTLIFFRSPVVAPDACTFLEMAHRLQEDPVAAMQQQDQHPGYPALIVFCHQVLNLFDPGEDVLSWIAAARVAPMICGILIVPVAWLFFRRTIGELAAGIAVLLLAVLPVARQVSADTTSDSPHLLLYLLAAWTASEGAAHRRLAWFALCGMFSGLAFWVRPEGLAVAASLTLLAIVSRSWRAHFGTRNAWYAAAIATSAAALVISPYVLISGKISGKITSKPFWKESRLSDARRVSRPAGSVSGWHAMARASASEGRGDAARMAPAEGGTGQRSWSVPETQSTFNRTNALTNEVDECSHDAMDSNQATFLAALEPFTEDCIVNVSRERGLKRGRSTFLLECRPSSMVDPGKLNVPFSQEQSALKKGDIQLSCGDEGDGKQFLGKVERPLSCVVRTQFATGNQIGMPGERLKISNDYNRRTPRASESPINSTITLVDASGAQAAPWETPAYKQAMALYKPKFSTGVATALSKLFESLRFALLLPLLIGIVAAMRIRQPEAVQVSTATISVQWTLVMLLCFLGGQVSHRHVLPIAVFLLQGVALGLLQIAAWTSSLTKRRLTTNVGLIGATAIAMAILLPRCLRPLHYESLHVVNVVQWLKTETSPNDVLVTNHDLVRLYANVPYQRLDVLRPDPEIKLEDAAYASGHRYVVLGETSNYDPVWVDRLTKFYTPVNEIRGPRGKSPITIYEHKLLAAVRTGTEPAALR